MREVAAQDQGADWQYTAGEKRQDVGRDDSNTRDANEGVLVWGGGVEFTERDHRGQCGRRDSYRRRTQRWFGAMETGR